MSAADAIAAPPPASRRPPAHRRDSLASWRLSDRIGLALAWGFGLFFCAIIVALVLYFMVEGIRFVRPSMLVTNPQAGFGESETGGFLDPILGTLIMGAIAIAIALPVGTALAVWLTEYGRPAPLARLIESTIEMLSGAPEIVLALFGLLLFQSRFLGIFSQETNGIVLGRSVLIGGAMLSLVALALIVANVREGLQAIPRHVREASYAVGKTKIATTRRVLLPAARPSVITGTLLGLARVIGDTAIVLLLSGDTLTFQGAGGFAPLSLLRGQGTTLTNYIYDNAPTGDYNQPHKAYAATFVLLILVLVLNLVVDRAGRRGRELRWS